MKFVNIVRNSSGSVGIGTSEPSARLYVSGSYSASEATALFKAGFPSPLGGVGVLDVQDSSGNSLLFVSGSGFAGIGTNSSAYASAPKLDVVAGGDGRYALFERTGGGIAISLGSTSTTKLYNSWYSAGGGYYKVGYSGTLTEPSDSVSLVQDTSGKVGIGTSVPATKLAVYSGAVSANYGVFSGSLAAYVSAGALYTYWNTTSNYGTIVSVADGSGTAAPMQLRVGTSLAAHIDSSGNVGIGTASVSGKLHVYNASTATQYIGTVNHTLRLSADDSLGGVEISNAASTPIIFKMGAPGNEIGRFLPSGTWAATGSFEPGTDNTYDLGSSTKRWRNLYVNSVSGSLTGSNLTAGQIVVVGTGGVLSGSNKLYWYNANNWVGIGTNSPASQVDLYGTSGGRVQLGFDSPAFGVTIQAAATPWARYYSFQNSSNTILGSFGGYGGSNSLTYLFIGAAYDNTALRADQTTGNVTIGNASGTGRLYVTGSSTATTPTMVVREGVVTPQGGAGTFDVQNSAGTSILFVSGSGLVGIGTTTPQAKFHVVNNAVPNIAQLYVGYAGSNNYYDANTHYFRDGGANTRFTINSNGNIVPSTDNTSDLGSSTLRWRNVYATSVSGSLTGSNVSAGQVVVAGTGGVLSGSNQFFWSNSSSAVGIGTSSPAAKIHVSADASTSAYFQSAGTNTVFLRLGNNTDTLGYLGYTQSSMVFYTSNSERARIDSSGNVGINTTSMSLKLEVSGSDARFHDVRVGRGPGAAITNTLVGGNSGGALGGGAVYATIFGAYAGNYISTGNYNTLVGTQAGNNITTASNNTYLGANAGYRQSGGNNTSVGRDALIGGVGASATANTAIGVYAGQSVTSGGNNFFGGYQAGYSTTTGASNVALGSLALYSVSEGNYNVGAGYQAGYGITSGSNNVNLGYQSGYGITTGAQNILVGTVSGYRITTANYNTHVGGNAGVYNSASGNASLGYQALAGVDGSSTGANNVAIGYQAAYGSTTGYENVVIGYIAGYSTTSAGRNVVIGSAAGNAISTGGGNVAIGYAASYRLTTGTQTVSIGSGAAAWNTASDNTAVGFQALYGISGLSSAGGNTALGSSAGYSLTTGTRNLFAGYQAGLSNSVGNYNVMLGNLAGYATTSGSSNIAVGSGAAYALTTGNYNTVVGDSAGYEFTTASSNTYLGRYSGIRQLGSNNVGVGAESLNGTTTTSTASNNTAVGYRSGYAVTTGAGNVALGYRSGYALTTGAANVYIGNDVAFQNSTGTRNVIIGDTAGNRGAPSDVTLIGYRAGIFASGINNTALGSYALYGVDGSSTATNNTALGYQAGYSVTTGGNNTALGYQAGFSLTTGDQNVIVGRTAGYTLTGEQYNTFVGMNAGRYTKSSQNTSLGFDALLGQSGGTSTGAYNVAVGYGAGRASQTGNGNVFTGYQAGLLATDGNYNTLLGHQAGQTLTTGANNVVVGSGAATATATSSNSIVIGSGSIGIGSNTTVLGNSSTITTYLAGNVGVGTTSFTGRLYVSGSSSATPTIVARAGVPSPSAAILAALDNDATTRFAVYGVSNGGYGGTFGVGIGTNDPFDTLHVYKNEAGYDHYPWFSNAATGGGTILTLQGEAPGSNAIRSLNSFSNESWYIGGNGSANILAFKTNGGTERMRIDSSGNVGIGTATVSARLHVLGSTTTTTPTMLVKERQAADTGVAILDIQNSSGTSLFFVSGSGFIGVGTNTVATAVAGAYFHVSSSLAGNANAGISVGSQLLGTSINVYKGHTQIFQLANGTETVRITGAGNVGIGTGANISSKLVVNGNTSVTGSVLPGADNTYDLGSASPQLRWRTLHAVNISGSLSPTGATPGSVFFAGASGQIQQDNANLFWDDTNNRLGVGTATPGFKLEVFGDFAATSKSFVIPHPLKPGWKLRHGSLEGPENGIYARGRSESEVIDLPDYWVPLADENSITVHITPVGKWQSLYVDSVENNQIKIGRGWFMRLFRIKPKYFYVVTANRKDHTFEVEYSPLG